MKLNRKLVSFCAFAALLLGSTYSDALTLGRIRGAALLGRSLDLSVMVQHGAEEDVSSTCFEADVSYGDTPLESSRIVLSTQPGLQANSQLLRLTSSAHVDEAVVRVTVRAKCGVMASRQYTLLADVASEMAAAGPAAEPVARADAARRSATNAVAGAMPVAPSNAATSATVRADASSANAVPKQALTPKVDSAPKRVLTAAKPAVATANRTGNVKNAEAIESLQRRVDEIAKWQASNTNADALQQSETRTKALEADIRGLQLLTAKNQQNIQMVAAAVESNSTQDIGRPLAYGLGALLVVCLASLAYVVQRARASGYAATPWWSGGMERAPTQPAGIAARATVPGAMGSAASRPVGLAQDLTPSAHVDTDRSEALAVDSGGSKLSAAVADNAQAAATHPAGSVDRLARHDFVHSAPGAIKTINTREMLDVRQQAEFFMALGQHDEAVRLLESNIRGSADCNPLVFLDLLKIFHTLSRRADFERYREEFNAQFTGRIPPYASFLAEGNGLDAYEDICQQIVALWPTDYTVDYIEQCLVRLPEDDPEQGIDLEAFKDLLMLYGVLKRLDHSVDSNMVPFSASRPEPSQNMPLSPPVTAPVSVAPIVHSADASMMDIDLDLDLDLQVPDEPMTPSQRNNLIDFDVSSYVSEKSPKS